MDLLGGAAGRTRAVGGVVRDTILGRSIGATDLDLATELLPDEVTALSRKAGFVPYPTGIEHGTVTVRMDDLSVEVTTLREDVETDGRHAVVRFGTDWRRDAERRDFTLNALYADQSGELFDPLNCVTDCLEERVRFIGDPDRRLAEDRLRVYRFFRFSASHAHETFDGAGLEACARAAETLNGLAAERVGAELRRMLGLPRVSVTLRTMGEARVLALPQEALGPLERYERIAPRPNFPGRLAILLQFDEPKRLQERWRLSNDEIAEAVAIRSAGQLLGDFKVNEAAYRYPAVIGDALDVAAALLGWTQAGRSALLEQVQGVTVPTLPISGADLVRMGLKPGRALGLELERLERAWIDSGFALDREALLESVRR